MRQPIGAPRHSQLRIRTRIFRPAKLLACLLLAVAFGYAIRRRRGPRIATAGAVHPYEESQAHLRPKCVSRVGEGIDSINPCARPHVPVHAPRPPFPRLANANPLTDDCLESWLARGVVQCSSVTEVSDVKLDVVWTWVNGSDLRWQRTMAGLATEEGVYSPAFHFREQNELQYSVRSVFDALRGSIATAHILVADLPYDSSVDGILPSTMWSSIIGANGEAVRIAQTPKWLNFETVGCRSEKHEGHGRPILQLVTHSDVFHLPAITSDVKGDLESLWRHKALPSYNSKAIESRLGWIPGLGEAVLSFNDDFFLLKTFATTDFYSVFYGTVIRMDEGYYQQVRPVWDHKNLNDAGETGGLWHANYLLSKRFPRRLRPYLPHVPKVVTRSLHHEAVVMFKDHLYLSTQRRFRESKGGRGDIQLQWLSISLRVERWREALLWSFIVAHLGTLDQPDILGQRARTRLQQVLGVESAATSVITVLRGQRMTLPDMQSVWATAGLRAPLATDMLFLIADLLGASLDGHLPAIPKPGFPASAPDQCVLDLSRCWGSFWTDTEDVSSASAFKRVTFEHPDCGDCLIMALVNASGPRGLSAFLPGPSTAYSSSAFLAQDARPDGNTPILPLTDTWQETNFGLQAVLRDQHAEGGKVLLRPWSLRLLSRYLYITGRSPTQFHMISDTVSAAQACSAIEEDSSVSMLGLNDNVLYESAETSRVLAEWFHSRWPEKGWWERE